MPILHIVILSIIQGITEFLPISSSGHLLVFHSIVGNTHDQNVEITNLIMDIAVHAGTLFAVLIYFRKDIAHMTIGLKDILIGKFKTSGARLNINLLLSSIPVIIAGFAIHQLDPTLLRETWIVATTTILFGIVLWFTDATSPTTRAMEETNWKDATLIGLAQILALIPGTSRSGITMTASRFLGFTRTDAARYSMLLSTIAISGAGTLGGMDLMEHSSPELSLQILIAMILSFTAAIAAITLMMKWLTKQDFKIFAIYRILLGLSLFAGLSFGLIT